jgi:hypothetical protein
MYVKPVKYTNQICFLLYFDDYYVVSMMAITITITITTSYDRH